MDIGRLIEYTSWEGLWKPALKYTIQFTAIFAVVTGLCILFLAR